MTKKDKWGIIYCPKEGTKKTHKRWLRIQQYFIKNNIDGVYYISQHKHDIEDIAYHLCEIDIDVIIIVGGDSALNDCINGIMKSNKKAPQLGVVPNGFGNDFSKFWGFRSNKYIHTIDSLLKRHTRAIDVGCCHLTDTYGNCFNRYFLNCVNIGLAASIINIKRKSRTFFGRNTFSSLASSLFLLFKRKSFKLSFQLPGENITKKVMTACIGSSKGYGQTPSAVPYNGLLDISLVSDAKVMYILQGLWLLFTGRFLAHKNLKVWRTKSVAFTNISRAPISLDGRVVDKTIKKIDISILHEKIEFLIPE